MDNIDDVRALKQMLINAHDKPSTPLRGKSRGGGDWTPSSDKSLKQNLNYMNYLSKNLNLLSIREEELIACK